MHSDTDAGGINTGKPDFQNQTRKSDKKIEIEFRVSGVLKEMKAEDQAHIGESKRMVFIGRRYLGAVEYLEAN
jgi:hypothetical protein